MILAIMAPERSRGWSEAEASRAHRPRDEKLVESRKLVAGS